MRKLSFCFYFILFFSSCVTDVANAPLAEGIAEKPLTKMEKQPEEETSSLLNYVDGKGLRQGKWILYGVSCTDSTFPSREKWREGIYFDSKEEGVWLEYKRNGDLERKINYRSGNEIR